MVLEGVEAVPAARQLIGATNPVEAAPGSIRGDFALEVTFNMVHGSDSDESAEREIGIWFPSCPERRGSSPSSSPQRREILSKLGVEFEVVVPGVEELTGGIRRSRWSENARLKARAVRRRGGTGSPVVIGCDTDVVLDGKALGKPRRRRGGAGVPGSDVGAGARGAERAGGARGRRGAVWARSGRRSSSSGSPRRKRSATCAFGEWRGRSGGYAIQTLGSTLVERIEGSVSNVVGLPVGLLFELAPVLFARS